MNDKFVDISEQLSSLEKQISDIKNQPQSIPHVEFSNSITEDEFSYLAIGNSITKHGITDYWWGDWGMAASKKSSDYYHLVVSSLEKRFGFVNAACISGYIWEIQAHDRAETYDILYQYLFPGIDLVSIQLSENVFDISTLDSDYVSLIKHVREKCGSSVRVIVIDDFMSDQKSEIKKKICEETGSDFINLADIRGKEEFKAGIGSVIVDNDGREHIIEHNGVANHPNDAAMKIIADRILSAIE